MKKTISGTGQLKNGKTFLLYGEAAKILSALPCALAAPTDKVYIDVSTTMESFVLPAEISEDKAYVEHLGGNVAHHLENLLDDRLELRKSRHVRDKLEKLLLGSANCISSKFVLKDLVAIPSNTTNNSENRGLGSNDTAYSAILPNLSALFPSLVLGLGQRRVINKWNKRKRRSKKPLRRRVSVSQGSWRSSSCLLAWP